MVSEVPYTHLSDHFIVEQQTITRAIQKGCGHEVALVPDGGFQRALHDQVARSNKIFCVFPFFLVPSRRSAWGVLPYAWQTSVAVVLNRNHPAAIEWNEREAATSRIAADLTTYPSRHMLEWLERLILHTEALDGAALWVQGYVQFEILLETARGRDETRIAEALVRTNLTVETLAAATDRLQRENHRERSFFVVDPAEIRNVFRQIADDFQVITCAHDVHVPVGVGFSLSCSPMLLAEGRWKEILQVARRQYAPFADEFEPLGIRFDNENA